MYQILVLDLEECCFAEVYNDGEIKEIFSHHSEVPHKHRKGGQSAPRFARIRENEITLWYKKINEYLKEVKGEIYVGMSSIYYNRFLKHLSTYNKQKIIKRITSEYSGSTGIYDMLNRLEKEKNAKKS